MCRRSSRRSRKRSAATGPIGAPSSREIGAFIERRGASQTAVVVQGGGREPGPHLELLKKKGPILRQFYSNTAKYRGKPHGRPVGPNHCKFLSSHPRVPDD